MTVVYYTIICLLRAVLLLFRVKACSPLHILCADDKVWKLFTFDFSPHPTFATASKRNKKNRVQNYISSRRALCPWFSFYRSLRFWRSIGSVWPLCDYSNLHHKRYTETTIYMLALRPTSSRVHQRPWPNVNENTA